jgi:hypothetical protein
MRPAPKRISVGNSQSPCKTGTDVALSLIRIPPRAVANMAQHR